MFYSSVFNRVKMKHAYCSNVCFCDRIFYSFFYSMNIYYVKAYFKIAATRMLCLSHVKIFIEFKPDNSQNPENTL